MDNFSVRWTQTLTVSTAGPYAFTTTSDDGIRVSVDGAYVINDWTDHAPTTDLASAALGVGDHPIVVEYYEHGGGAVAVFSATAAPTSCLPGQWLAQYYPNISLSGTPSRVRCEASINNDWGGGGPSGVGVGVDNFSVRWTQTLTVSTAGPYAFTTTSDDGIRVSVDGAYVINDWTDHAPTTDLASAALGVGDHPIVVEYYEHGGGAVAVFSATAAPTSCLPGQWLAQYYPNISLSGTPSGVRCEASINNDWGGGGPSGVGVGVDNFSVRWTQTLTVSTAGPYAFTTTSDDGIRVSVDGAYVINDWTDHAPTTDLASAALGVGDHPIVVEYYEHGGGAVAVFSYSAGP